MNSHLGARYRACRCLVLVRALHHASPSVSSRPPFSSSASKSLNFSTLNKIQKIYKVPSAAKLLCSALLDGNFSQNRVWYRRPPPSSEHKSDDVRDARTDDNKDEWRPKKSGQVELMDFPWIIWPSLLLTLRNWFFTHFIIKPYYDPEFSMPAFREGAKQALVSVSEDLARGDLKSLTGRVTQECISQLRESFPRLSLKQKSDLRVGLSDIFFSFPYQLGVIFQPENEGKMDRIFVEITMCYHIYRDFQEFIQDKEDIRDNSFIHQNADFYNEADRITIANYRFIREFTKGTNDDWTINVINHFKPGQALENK
ncbi:m-AAA protease-interacting protein 1, mitochondrial [Hyalella azteca]|uniref:M-AAA protease-interacting protein 1, mitochondrial n=1 Tax=Hyalella azteca TaxID=294128 RepID=A0A8B7MYK6_HYAAZ|nr:m-AAA protease-interacting protein 1, mitochondrial [Hyalella azteca]